MLRDVAPDRGQPRLGARRDARRPVGRARAPASTPTRSSAAGGWPRTPRSCSRPGTRALTHCNAGGLATGGYGSAVGALLDRLGARPARARLGRRDAAAAAGRAADRLGARDGGDPARGDRRLGRRVADGARARSTACHRRRPDRRERRHREQDRHVLARRARAPPRRSRSTSSRRARPSTSRRPTAPRSRSRSATGAEITARFAARNPAFDVTPAELIAAIVTEAGVHRAPYAAVARRARSPREGDHPRRGLRDPPAAAHRHVGEGAAAGRRPADRRLDPRRASPRSTRSTRCTSSRTRARRRRSAAGREGRGRDRPRRRHDDRTRTGSARSATCSS